MFDWGAGRTRPPCSGWVWGGEAVVTPQGIAAPKFDAYVPTGQAAAAPSRLPLAAVDSLGFRSPLSAVSGPAGVAPRQPDTIRATTATIRATKFAIPALG